MAKTKVSASGVRTFSKKTSDRLQSQIDAAKSAVAGLKATLGKPTVTPTATTAYRPPSARGDDFAEGVAGDPLAETAFKSGADMKPRTAEELKRASFSLAGGGSSKDNQTKGQQIAAAAKAKRQEKRQKRMAAGRLATDNLRASQTNLAQDEAVTTQGARSSRVLTDEEVAQYGSQGYFEGDMIPGVGVIKPDGRLDTSEVDRQNTISLAKEQALKIQAEIDKLRARETKDEFKGVVSDESIVTQEQTAINKLNEPDTVISGALQLLQQQEDVIQKQLDAEVKAAKQSYEMARGDTEGKQAREAGALSTSLASAGGYLGFTGSGTGVMLTLTKSHRAEMDRLKLERDRAISVARQKAAEKQFDAVREQAQLVERIENEAYDRQVEYQTQMKEAADKQKAEADARQNENDVFSFIQKGIKSPQEIYAAMGGSLPIAEINKILNGFLPDGLRSGGGFKFTPTNTASLLGTGLSQDDILALNEYVNDNGYDEKVRSSLTASQRAVADKIFKTSSGTGSTAMSKPMGVLDLDRIEELYGVRFPYGVTQGEVTQFFEDNAGASPEELQAALDQMLGGGDGGDAGDVTIDVDYINNNMTDTQKKRLADKVGASAWYTPASMDINRLLSDQMYLDKIKDLSEADLLEIFGS